MTALLLQPAIGVAENECVRSRSMGRTSTRRLLKPFNNEQVAKTEKLASIVDMIKALMLMAVMIIIELRRSQDHQIQLQRLSKLIKSITAAAPAH